MYYFMHIRIYYSNNIRTIRIDLVLYIYAHSHRAPWKRIMHTMHSTKFSMHTYTLWALQLCTHLYSNTCSVCIESSELMIKKQILRAYA